tara:strand:- start:289 stop:456 length:168 start_codon:yes stop_codon:yes gene_type:complete
MIYKVQTAVLANQGEDLNPPTIDGVIELEISQKQDEPALDLEMPQEAVTIQLNSV